MPDYEKCPLNQEPKYFFMSVLKVPEMPPKRLFSEVECFLSTTHFEKIGLGCDLDYKGLYINEMYVSKSCGSVRLKHILEYGKTYIHNQLLGKFIKNEQERTFPNYSGSSAI